MLLNGLFMHLKAKSQKVVILSKISLNLRPYKKTQLFSNTLKFLSMRKITLLLLLLLGTFSGFAQLTAQTEGFEGSTLPDLATDQWVLSTGTWGVFDNGVGTTQSWTVNNGVATPPLVHSGTNAAYMNRENIGLGNTSQDFLATPAVTIPADGQLRFWTRSTISGDNFTKYKVMVSTGATQNNPAAYTLVQQWDETTLTSVFNIYEEKTVSLAAYAGQTVFVAFVMEFTQPTAGLGGDRWLVDDVRIVEQCLDPTNLNANLITQTSASLSWTNPSGSTQWEIEIMPVADTPMGTGILISNNPYVATTTTTTITTPAGPLQPSTQYKFYVRSICTGNIPSEWVGPFNFTTTSPGLTCNSPIVIPGTPYSTDDNTANYGDTTDVPQPASCAGGNTNYMTGNDVFYSYTPTTSGAISITMTPNANWSGIFVYEGCANVGATCVAGVANNGNGVRDIPSLNVTAGQEYIIVISTNATPQTVGYSMIIQTLNCAPPTGLNATGTGPTSANLSWNAGVATSSEVFVQTAGSPIPSTAGTQTNINTNYPVTTTQAGAPLALGIPYQYWVRADCGDGTFSPWAGPYAFNTTSCSSGCNYNFVMTDAFGDGWNGNTMNVIQNGLTIATIGGTFTTGTGPVSVAVPLCDGPFELFWNTGGSFANEVGVSIVNSFNQTLFTYEAGSGTPGTTLYSGTVNCSTPACLPPENITVTAIDQTQATFNWTPGGNETAWQVIAVPSNQPAPLPTDPGWIPAPNHPFVLTGLTSGTNYNFYVMAVCSPGDLSGLSSAFNFNTSICPASNQCLYTFTMTDAFGDGWNGNTMSIIQNGITVATIGSTFTTGTGPVTVQVPLCNGIAFSLYWNTGGAFANEVGVSITSFLGEEIFTYAAGSGTPGSELYSGTGECVAPTCLKPTNVTVSQIGLDQALVTWQENNTPPGTSWDIIILPASDPAPTPTTPGWTNVSTNPYLATGLSAATLYKAYVRTVCSATDSSFWSVGAQFGTLICLPSNLCEYTFTMVDSFGDTWNGNTMNVTQNGILVATLTGPTFADGQNPVSETISLCNGIPFELFWNNGGNFAGEVGISIFNTQTGANVFTHAPGSGAQQGTQLFAGTVTCIPATCPKPVQLTVSNVTTDSATLSWTESASATQWEIIILPAGSPPPTIGTPGIPATNPYTVTGLSSGTAYVYYVHAICSPTDISNWAGPKAFSTLITNDECTASIVVPVNPDQSCTSTVSGTVTGATASSEPNSCGGTADDDVWFQFTATGTTHTIDLNNITGSTTDMYMAVYEGTQCGSLTPLYCSDAEQSVANNLTPGQTYTVRVYTWTSTPNQTSQFTICIGTIPPPISTSVTQYTTTQLVTDVLLNNTCATVSNVTSSTGTNFGLTTNGIGYFNQNGSGFPFEDGIVLTSGNAANAPGPNTTNLSEGDFTWPGDADLLQVLNNQGITGTTNNASVLEFDFVPITNEISFNFIFASEEYGIFQCSFSDVFAFLLTNTASGVTTNLAVVPNTTTPIAVYTIRDALYNNGCPSVNPQYFGNYYDFPAQSPLGAPINYNGATVPLTASAPVVPGTMYHIKLAIADFNDSAYDSAVFLEGGSFGLGNLELGDNLLVSTGTALCTNESTTLTVNLDPALYTFQWLEGGNVIDGATGPSLTVDEAGTYTLQVQFIGTTCTGSDSIVVEYYDQVQPAQAPNLYQCSALNTGLFDLTVNQAAILAPLGPNFNLTYYTTQDDATNDTNPILNPLVFANTSNPQTIYVRAYNSITGCVGFTSFELILQDLTPQFTLPGDMTFCVGNTQTIAVTAINFDPAQATYVWTQDGNTLPDTGSSISVSESGVYSVTVTANGCSDNHSVTVNVVPGVDVVAPDDVVQCGGTYVLPELTLGTYYTATGGPNGTGQIIPSGTVISESTTVYIFADGGSCTDEDSYTITINQAPDLGTFDNVSACPNYTLPALAVGAYYTAAGGPMGGGVLIPDLTVLTSDQTVWVYAANGTCVSEASFTVTLGS
ncbi:MAG: hypothetical protein EOO51_13380, partial [Flavobacterium sp.]